MLATVNLPVRPERITLARRRPSQHLARLGITDYVPEPDSLAIHTLPDKC